MTVHGPYEHTGAYMDPPTFFGAPLPSKSEYAEALAAEIGEFARLAADNAGEALGLAAAYLATDVTDPKPGTDSMYAFERWLTGDSALRRLRAIQAVQLGGFPGLARMYRRQS